MNRIKDYVINNVEKKEFVWSYLYEGRFMYILIRRYVGWSNIFLKKIL